MNAHRTAITRRTLSAPARYLSERGLFVGRGLDYGCGKGFDARLLGLDKYDPHFSPELPAGRFSTVMCNYVLNVVTPEEGKSVLDGIRSKLASGGTAYITVRRDVKVEGTTSKGTFQRNVVLDLPVLYERKNSFCIYMLGSSFPANGR